MKRIISSLLMVSFLLCLFGCDTGNDEETAKFYYVRNSYVYGKADGVMASEEHDVAEFTSEEEILRSYLDGPLNAALSSPFPYGTQIADLHYEGETLYITLSAHIVTLSKAKQVLACACFARTAMELTGVTAVYFQTDSTDIARMDPILIDKDSILLYDGYNAPDPSETN